MGWGGLSAAGFGVYGSYGGYEPRPSRVENPRPPQGGSGVVRPKPLQVPPVRVLLFCPRCRGPHVDRDEWATRSHKTHLCEHCKHEWDPSDVPTVGVETP